MISEFLFILFLPLFSAAAILLFLRKKGALASLVSVASSVICFGVLVYILLEMHAKSTLAISASRPMFELGSFTFNMGLLFDKLSANMIFVVLFVGMLIHIFSLGYMKHDSGKARFFGGLSFFMFSMTGIVFADNLLMMFVFWEFVGFSSYMLIAHYADTPEAANASKKAFIVNRVGDFGFLLGIIFCYHSLGTLNFSQIASILAATPEKATTAMGLLVMCGFLGKSAQMPLQVWLTDAMAGPTPVSALIHAATMVVAGVFMMCRLGMIGFLTPDVLQTVLLLCSMLSMLAGFWALGQRDVKKTLAYSTLAHLGLMGVAVGLGAYGVAMFHLTTHAFFKAALFLVAGSVIYGCHHEQDMFKMGGLYKKMPVTTLVALIAGLSLIATPFFAGYYSKDAILALAYANASEGTGVLVWLCLIFTLIAAFMTPLYTGRLFFNVFLGKPQGENAAHARESGFYMTLPLVMLAIFSFAAAMGVKTQMLWGDGFMNALLPVSVTNFISVSYANLHGHLEKIPHMHAFEIGLGIATLVFLALSYLIYGKNRGIDPVEKRFPIIFGALKAHGWFDNVYDYYVAKVQQRFASLVNVLDLLLIHQVFVRGSAALAISLSEVFRRLHSRSTATYAKFMLLGIVVIVIILIKGR